MGVIERFLETRLCTEDKDFLTKLQKAGIACIDLIDEIEAPENLVNYIFGKGLIHTDECIWYEELGDGSE